MSKIINVSDEMLELIEATKERLNNNGLSVNRTQASTILARMSKAAMTINKPIIKIKLRRKGRSKVTDGLEI